MSAPAPPTGVVVPTKDGEPVPSAAAAVTPMKGGMALSPLPLGGGKRRGTKRLSKKALKMLKKMTPKQLKKMMKGGEDQTVAPGGQGALEGARRRKTRKSRRSGLLY